MKHISFFSGIGGIDLGAKKAGIETIANVEINQDCRKILKVISPNAIQYEDITAVQELKQTLPKAEIFSGGFPCQDASNSNTNGEGTKGKKTGLYKPFIELCGYFRPKYIVLENVPNIINRGFADVLSEIAQIGYNAEWTCLQASDFGYPHRRERLFIVAYPVEFGLQQILQRAPKDYRLHESWTASKTYQSFAAKWNEGYIHTSNLPRDNGIRGIEKGIFGAGNAVIPVIAQYIFLNILDHAKSRNNHIDI